MDPRLSIAVYTRVLSFFIISGELCLDENTRTIWIAPINNNFLRLNY